MSTFFKNRREKLHFRPQNWKKNQPIMNWPVLDFEIEISEKKKIEKTTEKNETTSKSCWHFEERPHYFVQPSMLTVGKFDLF